MENKEPMHEIKTEEDVTELVLSSGSAIITDFEVLREGDKLYIPELKMHIRPFVVQLFEKAVSLGFDMYTEKWDAHMYENCTAMGTDLHTAAGQAMASFNFAFISGLRNAADKYAPRNISSSFGGKTHNGDVYLSNVVSTSFKEPDKTPEKISFYWELLKDDIARRLGNRKFAYIKIYAAKLPDSAIGECRIDDTEIPELSEKVRAVSAKWDSDGLLSEKQFFFIEQQPQTVTEYPYSGSEGREKMKKQVLEYLKLFSSVKTKEDYALLPERAAEILGDKTLAQGCFAFLPEICAENAFSDRIRINDSIEINLPGGKVIPAYSTQLSDYRMLKSIIFGILREKPFGENTRNVYARLIGCSSIYSIVEQLNEKDGSLEGASLTKIVFNMNSDYEIR